MRKHNNLSVILINVVWPAHQTVILCTGKVICDSGLPHETCWGLPVWTQSSKCCKQNLNYEEGIFLSHRLSAAVIENSAHSLVLKTTSLLLRESAASRYEYISVDKDRYFRSSVLATMELKPDICRIIYWWESQKPIGALWKLPELRATTRARGDVVSTFSTFQRLHCMPSSCICYVCRPYR